jgi:hypothetical protein
MGSTIKYVVSLVVALFSSCSLVPPDEVRTWTVDDFEDGDLKGASGLSWIVIADDLAGGATLAQLENRQGSTSGSRHALRLAGKLGGGNASFAGSWLTLERTGRNLDLSAFDGVRLRVKGPAVLDVGFRSGVINFMTRVEAGADWTLVDAPFSKLAPTGRAPEGSRWNPAAAQIFGVTTPQTIAAGAAPSGDVAFEIDDVALYTTKAGSIEPMPSGPPTGLAVVPFAALDSIPKTGWRDLGADPERDGVSPVLPDAIRFEAIPVANGDMLWSRISLRETPHDRWMGVNLAFDVDGDPANGFAWWGANKAFKFDRIVTVWCFRVADGCQGYIGVADGAQATAGQFVAGGAARLRVAIDRERRAFVVGVPRDLLGIGAADVRLLGAVGSAIIYADDVPNQGAAVLR